MTVGVMLETIGSEELTEWLGFSQLEPFGGMIEDLRAGIGAATTLNVNRGPDSEAMGPLDFFPWHKALAPAEPPELDLRGLTDQQRAQRMIYALSTG
jgi:hypothetical protein